MLLRNAEAQQPLGKPVDVDVPMDEHQGVVIEGDTADVAAAAGIVGTIAAMLPGAIGTAGVGSSAAELTPRLLISVEARGMPVLALPPGVVGAVEVGLEDAATLLEPEPHMPDMPAVSSVADVELCVMPDIVVAAIPDEGSIDAAVFPAMPPVAGVDPAIAIPPPS